VAAGIAVCVALGLAMTVWVVNIRSLLSDMPCWTAGWAT
jgi:hypothetical protein